MCFPTTDFHLLDPMFRHGPYNKAFWTGPSKGSPIEYTRWASMDFMWILIDPLCTHWMVVPSIFHFEIPTRLGAEAGGCHRPQTPQAPWCSHWKTLSWRTAVPRTGALHRNECWGKWGVWRAPGESWIIGDAGK